MTDNAFPGPMSMVKIDGHKIKQLREQQGLTQLYLATAVEVTTDTISRWENRRYPSIKRENGIKLAQALNVSLDDLLEEEQKESAGESLVPAGKESAPPRKPDSFRMVWPLLLLSLTLFTVLLAFLYYSRQTPVSVPFSAVRTIPPHCIAGLPFPVLISTSGSSGSGSALIVKETIPVDTTIHQTVPKVTAGSLKNNQIKWLKKVSETSVFVYIASINSETGNTITFSGTAANSNDANSPITGDSSIVIGTHHWADTNRDNVIGDNEILIVYDQYSDIEGIDLDIDLIEEIWLGSGYRWNSDTNGIEILE